MAVEYRGAGTVEAAQTEIQVPLPEGWEPEDLLVLEIESGGTITLGETTVTPTILQPGWKLLLSEVKKAGASGGFGATRLTIYYKIAAIGESGPIVSDTGDHQIGVVHALKKGTFNPTNPIMAAKISANEPGNYVFPEAVAEEAWAFPMFFVAANGPMGGGNSNKQLTFSLVGGAITELVERADMLVDIGDAGLVGAATGHLPTVGQTAAVKAEPVKPEVNVTATVTIRPLSPGPNKQELSPHTGGVSTAKATLKVPAGLAPSPVTTTSSASANVTARVPLVLSAVHAISRATAALLSPWKTGKYVKVAGKWIRRT